MKGEAGGGGNKQPSQRRRAQTPTQHYLKRHCFISQGKKLCYFDYAQTDFREKTMLVLLHLLKHFRRKLLKLWSSRNLSNWNEKQASVILQGPIVRKPINANPR